MEKVHWKMNPILGQPCDYYSVTRHIGDFLSVDLNFNIALPSFFKLFRIRLLKFFLSRTTYGKST